MPLRPVSHRLVSALAVDLAVATETRLRKAIQIARRSSQLEFRYQKSNSGENQVHTPSVEGPGRLWLGEEASDPKSLVGRLMVTMGG